jgi:hypothetical protein
MMGPFVLITCNRTTDLLLNAITASGLGWVACMHAYLSIHAVLTKLFFRWYDLPDKYTGSVGGWAGSDSLSFVEASFFMQSVGRKEVQTC